MSEVKVNKISPRSGTDVQLGDSGDTFTIPSGATINNQGTAVNFGATGSASWVTTVKTGDFTAVAGEGYFINTTSGEVDVALPAGTAGAVVAFKDYAGTFDTNKVTLVQNGSDKIGGSTTNSTLTTEGIAVTLVFIDSTQGWLVTDSGLQDEAPGAEYVTATGGTITTVCTNFKVHTFTGPGTFAVSNAGNASGSTSVDYMVVAGGGGGGKCRSGAGGGGGYRESPGSTTSYTASPLGSSPAAAIAVSVQSYPITVGSGGAGSSSASVRGSSGTVSTFDSITSAGGGGGGSDSGSPVNPGGSGGSGGGGANSAPGGSGNTPPVSPAQGKDGGNSASGSGGGGGGGASACGGNMPGPSVGGTGGAGTPSAITGSGVTRAGGGGGGSGAGAGAPGGAGGGGNGVGNGNPTGSGDNGGTNLGGGGGGTAEPGGNGGTGGSGIVVIRYKFQN